MTGKRTINGHDDTLLSRMVLFDKNNNNKYKELRVCGSPNYDRVIIDGDPRSAG